jgi:hypothetical protein
VGLADDEQFTCRCGTRKDGAMRGPRGGRQWLWQIGEDRLCGPKCPLRDELAIERAQDDARGDWEADQAMQRFERQEGL